LSPIVATKTTPYNENEEIMDMIVTIFKSKIKHCDLGFFGLIESMSFVRVRVL
jgi:hypothetical protein